MIFLAPLLLILGLLQLVAAYKDLRGASLTGRFRRSGYLIGGILFVAGVFLFPGTIWVLVMVLPAGVLALVSLVAIGSLAGRSLDPAHFLRPGNLPEGCCQAVSLPNGAYAIPGLFIVPPAPTGAAVCLAHGSGDNKTAFKWRLIRALLSL